MGSDSLTQFYYLDTLLQLHFHCTKTQPNTNNPRTDTCTCPHLPLSTHAHTALTRVDGIHGSTRWANEQVWTQKDTHQRTHALPFALSGTCVSEYFSKTTTGREECSRRALQAAPLHRPWWHCHYASSPQQHLSSCEASERFVLNMEHFDCAGVNVTDQTTVE